MQDVSASRKRLPDACQRAATAGEEFRAPAVVARVGGLENNSSEELGNTRKKRLYEACRVSPFLGIPILQNIAATEKPVTHLHSIALCVFIT